MKHTVLLFLITACLWTPSNMLFAQKAGHLNFGNLMESHPQTQKADQVLTEYRNQLEAEGSPKAKLFQEKMQAFQTKVHEGALSPEERQKQQAALEREQKSLINMEAEFQRAVEAKRQELLSPIVTEIEKAIQQVAQEEGYQMIFDTSVFNAVLFAEDSDDVFSLVKAKLER